MSEYLAQQAAAAAHQQAATPRPIDVLLVCCASPAQPQQQARIGVKHLAKQANQPAGQPQPHMFSTMC